MNNQTQESHSDHIQIARDPFSGAQIRFGVMGSAGGDLTASCLELCRVLGRAIAESGCCLLTGACPGLPHAAVLGAKEAGGHVIGVSPAMSLKEHVETFDSPYKEYDVLIFTGLGLMGRELINIRTSNIIIVVGGRSGTLGEFSIAYEEGKLIGVLTGTGGITMALPALENTLGKKTGAEVIYEANPQQLIRLLLERYLSGSYVCPCDPAEAKITGEPLHSDPVCKMRIDEQQAKQTLTFQGETYYFCSEACLTEFQRHSEDYMKKAQTKQE